MTQVDYMVQAELDRAAIEQGPDAIIIVDRGGVIIRVNEQSWTTRCGSSDGSSPGSNLASSITGCDDARIGRN